MKKNGISLIVLIVTIIVIIILAAVVILTLSKNNPIESAKEATFKEDLRAVQDQVEMYIASRYQKELNDFDKNTLNISGETLVSDFGMPVKYKDKVAVKKGKVIYKGKDEKEKKWANDNAVAVGLPVPAEWKKHIASITEDGVPIPKGFIYKEGTKATGVVIEDGSHNEFVWIPSTESEYVKDFTFPSYYGATSSNTSEETFLSGLDETLDVKKYGGFYIGRYEATTYDGTETTKTNTTRVPTCQSGKTVWTNIDYTNSKASAESMYTGENSSVQSGLLTGKAWDRTCHWIEDYITTINTNSTLRDSRYYGNYKNSEPPANTGTYTSNLKQLSGANDNWKTKNIYDLAGNVWEWTYEADYSSRIHRGGGYFSNGDSSPVSYRSHDLPSYTCDYIGFRLRLYIKTN